MKAEPLIAIVLLLTIASVLSYYIRRGVGPELARQAPGLLELTAPLVLLALAMLPEATPSAFAHILHHSIESNYVYPTRADGTQVTETWVSARWWVPIGRILYVSIWAGMLWAAVNVFKAYDRKLNIALFCCGIIWTVGAFVSVGLAIF